MPPKKKQKKEYRTCDKCSKEFHLTRSGFFQHYTRHCEGKHTKLVIPGKAVADTHEFENFHKAAEGFGPGNLSLPDVESRINSRFDVEQSLKEKSDCASLKSPPEVAEDVDESTVFNSNDNDCFEYDPEPTFRDIHGCPIVDVYAANVFQDNGDDPTRHMASLGVQYEDLYNNRFTVQPGIVIDEDIEDVNHANTGEFDKDEWQKYREKCPDSKDWSREYEYNGDLPSYYVALIDLLKILDTHQVDLKVFDSILEWVMHHSLNDPNIWKNNYTTPSRGTFIGTISKVFRTEHLLPKIKPVKLIGGEIVSLPYFDFEDMFLSLVTDKKLNQPENMIRDDFDKDTWKPTKLMEDWTDDDMINDVNSGTFFHEGLLLSDLSTDLPDGVDEVRIVGLQFFIDKSHGDHMGALATTPVSFTIWPFNNGMRRKNEAWRQLAYIPNLEVGQGTNKGYDPQRAKDKAAGKKVEPKYKSKLNKLKNQHILYRAAFETLRDVVDQGGIRTVIDGKVILFKIFVGMIVCDTVGANEFCCHYNSTGNSRVQCLCKCCKCGFEDLITIPPQCESITRADIVRSLEDPDHARLVSQHPVPSAFNELPLVDTVCGINGICPFENLHVMCNGLFIDVIGIISDILGERKTNESQKDELDYVFRLIATELSRCSDRDKPRWSIRFGCLDNSRLTGSERTGILWILSITIYTDWGRDIIGPHLKKRGISVKAFVYTITLLLSYDRWTQDTHTLRWELDWAEPALCELMELMQQKLPNPRKIKQKNPPKKKNPKEKRKGNKPKKGKKKTAKKVARKFKKRARKDDYQGSNGWYKIKYHALWGLMLQMRKYGSATNFHGGPGEEHHKENFKNVGFIGNSF